METTIYKIDATGRALGRVASEAAVVLRGKNQATFERHILPKQKVEIHNAAKLKLNPHKATQTKHERYTGYPGGLKYRSLAEVIAKKGYAEPLKLAIHGMLPANRLRSKIMLNLKIYD